MVDAKRALRGEELSAVQAFAAQHGRRWKEVLRTQWNKGIGGPVLTRLRESHGPLWLYGFRLPRPRTAPLVVRLEHAAEALRLACVQLSAAQWALPDEQREAARELHRFWQDAAHCEGGLREVLSMVPTQAGTDLVRVHCRLCTWSGFAVVPVGELHRVTRECPTCQTGENVERMGGAAGGVSHVA